MAVGVTDDEALPIKLGDRIVDKTRAAGRTLKGDRCGDARLRSRKELSRCEQADSAIDEFKHLLRRLIAVDLSGFYP